MYVLKNLLLRSEVRFGLVGLANTLFGLLVIFSLKWIGFVDVAANALGYACGLLLSFALNSRWTFSFEGRTIPALGRFVLVIMIAYSANLATVLTTINWFGLNSYFAQASGVIPYTIFAYVGSRWFAFR
jgi:putative flippase GtrA